jgi:PAS domain S-box-containing protein
MAMDEPVPLNVLIVEDEPEARANLRDILELDGHRIDEAGSAAEALADRDWAALDVVILDRQLPDASAETLMPMLRARSPGVAIMVVTGHGDLQGAIAALRQGANDYILKPLNVDALNASLGRLAERRRLARAKERSEANFRHLVEAADCLILILRPDRTVTYLSPFSEHLTGYRASEVLGRDFFERFLPEARRPAALAEFARLLAGGQTHGYQATILGRDGAPHWVVLNARLLPDYDGGPAVLAVGQDITSLKQAQERALQSERLAAIGQMVAGLAHESRNALQRSQACLEMLRFEVEDRPRALDLIGRLQAAQDHLHCLYEDVRGYAAPIQLDRRPVRLDEVWREAWNHAEPARAGKAAELREPDSPGVNLVVTADPFRIGQVFRNIFENACAACEPPVVVEVWAEDTQVNGVPSVAVHVLDNGPGIGPEAHAKLFEPFYTTKTKGTGLGLSIARRIVEAHCGSIALADRAGPGAEFLITLPRD